MLYDLAVLYRWCHCGYQYRHRFVLSNENALQFLVEVERKTLQIDSLVLSTNAKHTYAKSILSLHIIFTMAAVQQVLPYDLYSDAPGVLLNKPEWEQANSAHIPDTDFGDLPEGWPKRIQGPLVWDGKDLENHPERFIRVLSPDEIVEIAAALKVTLLP